MVSAAGFEPATHALKGQHGTSPPISFYNMHAARRHIKRLFGVNWPQVGPKFSYEKKLGANRFSGPYGLDIASKPSDIRFELSESLTQTRACTYAPSSLHMRPPHRHLSPKCLLRG